MSTLYELVDQLTHPHDVPVYRGTEYIRTRTDPPLLTALADARTSSLGRGGETRSRQERVQLNLAASQLHEAIRRRIRTWARDAGYRPPHTGWPTTRLVLRRWYALTRDQPDTAAKELVLRQWIDQINDLVLDPPRKAVVEAPCPHCGERWVRLDEEHTVSTLQRADRDPITATTITCRNCDHTWHGLDGARQLALDIDRRKTA